VTQLRKKMLEELRRRNYSHRTARAVVLETGDATRHQEPIPRIHLGIVAITTFHLVVPVPNSGRA
jgi:hypothetical protein